MINIEINALENEKMAAISFYKKQVEAFRHIKREIEKVEWADANYDQLVDSVNTIASALASIIQTISNGTDVYVVDEVLMYSNKYLENERKFPRI